MNPQPALPPPAASSTRPFAPAAAAPLMVVTVFTPKQGQLDALVETHADGLRNRVGAIAGLRGGRLLRAADGSRAVLVSAFDSEADYQRWLASPELAAHRERLRPYVERAEPGAFELVYQSGTI